MDDIELRKGSFLVMDVFSTVFKIKKTDSHSDVMELLGKRKVIPCQLNEDICYR